MEQTIRHRTGRFIPALKSERTLLKLTFNDILYHKSINTAVGYKGCGSSVNQALIIEAFNQTVVQFDESFQTG